MYHRRYEKVFLMLRQETAGYALGKRPPWGSCVMELKNGRGRLHLTIQGLKPGRYSIYILAGQESIFCGEAIPEKKEGRCTVQWEFDPDAVGVGKKAEDFHTVIVLAEGTSAPLAAYFGEKRDWRADFRPQEEAVLQAAEALPIAEQEQEESPHTALAEEQKTSYHGSFQGLLARFRQELEELEESGILSEEETAKIRSVGTEEAEEEKTEEEKTEKAEESDEKESKETAESGLLGKNAITEPFGDGEKWRQISLEELTLFAEIPLEWQRRFFFLLPYRKYHHLILREEAEGIWLGLPQKYDAADDADAKQFGFSVFRRVEDEWGYRLTFLKRNG